MDEKHETIRQKRQEIINLQSSLSATVSPIGDWKVVKTYEARLLGNDDPYDTEQLIADRQAIRDKINALQAELAELEKAEEAEG